MPKLIMSIARLSGWKFLRFCLLLTLFSTLSPAAHGQPAGEHGKVEMTLDQYVKQVLERNESVQEKLLEFEINRRRNKAEYGAFEPELFAAFSRERNKRRNTALEARSQQTSQTNVFSEYNNIYQGGIESLVPTGAKIQLGYTLRDLRNNLQTVPFFLSPAVPLRTNGEYQTFFGLTATQPLLKNGWFPATLASLRVAALGSDIAFQDYRRQLMVIISTAEASYWNLYLSQEQSRFFQESVATAEKILNDNRARLQAGKSAEIEVLEAEAGLALRRSKLSEAEHKRYESASKVLSLFSETALSTNRHILAVDQPRFIERQVPFFEAYKEAYEWNPDYLSQRQKVLQEYVREGYALNQRLPELNLKGSYGLNGLAETPARSWEDVENADFPSWMIGVEFRVPLGGGIKSANELAAARLRRKEALLALKELENQIVNALDTSLHKLSSARETVKSAETAVHFNEKLLESALARLDVGKLESRKVFEIESDLFESRNSVIEGLVNYQRALLELELVEGSTLRRRNIELTQKDLQTRTMQLAKRIRIGDDSYRALVKEMQAEYEKQPSSPPDNPAQQKAREQLYQYMNRWDATNTPSGSLKK